MFSIVKDRLQGLHVQSKFAGSLAGELLEVADEVCLVRVAEFVSQVSQIRSGLNISRLRISSKRIVRASVLGETPTTF